MDEIKVEDTNEHINSLKNWTPSQSVLHFVKGMGLEYITNGDSPAMSYPIKHPYDLIDVVIKAYNVEQRAFILPDGTRLVYSLDDVFRLTGLPISGKPVIGDEKGGKKKFLGEFGGAPGASTALFSGEKIKTAWLKETFMNRGHNYNSTVLEAAAAPAADLANQIPLDVKQHVKAYMLYFIHCFIIPDTNGSGVPALYLQFLDDIYKIQTYAWGAASLANLHHSLEKIKTSPSRVVGGLIYPLLLFFFEHIPNLVQIPRDNLPTKFPLMVEWTHLLYDKVGKKKTKESLKFSSIFTSAGEQEVTWMPYKRLKNDFVPPNYETHFQWALSRTTLHCMEKCVYHRPDLAPRQFGFDSVDENDLRPLIVLRVVQHRTGPNTKDFLTYKNEKERIDYPKMLAEWHSRSESVLRRAETVEEDTNYQNYEHVLEDDIGGFSGVGGDYPFGGKQWRV